MREVVEFIQCQLCGFICDQLFEIARKDNSNERLFICKHCLAETFGQYSESKAG